MDGRGSSSPACSCRELGGCVGQAWSLQLWGTGGSTWETVISWRAKEGNVQIETVIARFNFIFCVLLLYFSKQECCLQGLGGLSGMQTPLRGNGPRLWREFLWPHRRHRGEMLTRTQHMYSTPGRPLRDAVTSRSLSKADSATAGARISRGYSEWVTGHWKRNSLHFNAPYRADLWRG